MHTKLFKIARAELQYQGLQIRSVERKLKQTSIHAILLHNEDQVLITIHLSEQDDEPAHTFYLGCVVDFKVLGHQSETIDEYYERLVEEHESTSPLFSVSAHLRENYLKFEKYGDLYSGENPERFSSAVQEFFIGIQNAFHLPRMVRKVS